MDRVNHLLQKISIRLVLLFALIAASQVLRAADLIFVVVGRIEEQGEDCSVELTEHPGKFSVVYRCYYDASIDRRSRDGTLNLWLLLEEGAAPELPSGIVGSSAGDHPIKMSSLGRDFKNTREPIAVVVKYMGTFHVFPVSKEDLAKIDADTISAQRAVEAD